MPKLDRLIQRLSVETVFSRAEVERAAKSLRFRYQKEQDLCDWLPVELSLRAALSMSSVHRMSPRA